MATILQKPDGLSLLGNLKTFIASSTSEVSFRLLKGTDVIVDEIYYPDADGNVEVDVKDLIKEYLDIKLPSSNIYLQSEGSAQIGRAHV